MNETSNQAAPENQKTNSPGESQDGRPKFSSDRLKRWLRHLLACNPFYLFSVVLLLYGCYRISLDPKVFNKESAHLFFNFGSLQAYELVLTCTAILLSRREIWYDSTLLVGLENLLLLAPFILISQAGLIERKFLWLMCGVAGVLAVLRVSSLKAFISKLNFPRRLVLVAWLVISINVILPVVYRTLHENKIGTHLEAGAAYYTNEFSWLLILPLLCGLAVLLPKPITVGELWPQRRCLPLGLFGLWMAGTGVHLYCLGYVYDFGLRGELLAPALWVSLWMLRQRINDIVLLPHAVWGRVLLILPLASVFVSYTSAGSRVFLTLSLLNAILYGCIFFFRGKDRLSLHLLLISFGTSVMALPEGWRADSLFSFTRSTLLVAAFVGYCLLWIILSRNPLLGFVGAFIVFGGSAALLPSSANSLNWSVQAGFAFLVLHSLLWPPTFRHAKRFRLIAAAFWIVHGFIWMEIGGMAWMAFSVSAFVLAIYLSARLIQKIWGPAVIPLAAIMVMLSGPCDSTAGKLRLVPIGIIAVAGSFFLFGIGTAAALTRHRW